MQAAEIELKFPVADPQALHTRLSHLGFHLTTPRTYEHNTLYDTPGRNLRAQAPDPPSPRVRRHPHPDPQTHRRLREPRHLPLQDSHRDRDHRLRPARPRRDLRPDRLLSPSSSTRSTAPSSPSSTQPPTPLPTWSSTKPPSAPTPSSKALPTGSTAPLPNSTSTPPPA